MSAPTRARTGRRDVSRRRFLGYLVAAPPSSSPPQLADTYDLLDAIRDTSRPTSARTR